MVELKLSFDDLPAIYNLSQKQSKENDDKYLPALQPPKMTSKIDEKFKDELEQFSP